MRDAKCKYFGRCGGCSAQHIEYSVQLDNKKKLLQSAVKEFPGKIEVYSDEEFAYRNRMDLVFHPKGVGFREKGKWWKIVDIEECVISNPRLNELLDEVRDYFKTVDAFDLKKQIGTFKYAVIRTPQKMSSISFVLNQDSSRVADAVEKIKQFAQKSSADTIVVTYVDKKQDLSTSIDYFVVKGSEMLEENYLGKTFKYSVQGFYQNNFVMAEKMHEYVNGLLEKHDTSNAHLLDIYAGVGTFGIINGDLFKSVTIIEAFAGCIDAAKENIELNNMNNARAHVLDAKYLKRIELQKPLFVITDPPRSGMHQDTITQLNRLSPDVIVYVSCNLHQLAKDIPKFYNYEVKSAAIFDLFPQTKHCEGVVELVKKKEFVSQDLI